jgi:hypothetical protein
MESNENKRSPSQPEQEHPLLVINPETNEYRTSKEEIERLKKENEELRQCVKHEHKLADSRLSEVEELESRLEKMREALHNLLGQVLQARDGFGIWPYGDSDSMKKAIEEVKALTSSQDEAKPLIYEVDRSDLATVLKNLPIRTTAEPA